MPSARKRERILPRFIEEEMRESFLDYSMSVIVQRALPDVRDGLKPVHRRILYAMHELGLMPDRAYKKCATVVGDVLGKYHPHGDAAVYDALVRMVQDFSLRCPLVDGQGNFGSIDGDNAAAYRYTEARLQALAVELLDDIHKETVLFQPNFDDRLKEPVVLPARFPNLLVNGSSGIAVGMSTNVPPHCLREVAAGVKQLVIDPDCTVADLMRHIDGPDFPTAGFIVGREGIKDMYETGRGRLVMRARVVKEALRGGKEQLVVTELPYTVSKTKIIDQIADLAKRGKLDDVSDIRDETDRDGIRLVIELKRGAKAGRALKTLYKRTNLQYTFGAIMLALDHGQPKEFDLKQLLERFRDHRLEVIQKRSRFDLEKAEAERHVLQGLLVALDHIDEVIKIIRGSKDRAQASDRLQNRFGLSETQADAILNMRLARLTALERSQLEARMAELKTVIKDLKAILGSEERQLEVMLEELSEVVKAHGDPRRTVILDKDEEDGTRGKGKEEVVAEVEEQIADEDVVITLSHEGFVKRVPMHLYRRRVSAGKGLAGMERYDDDYLERIFVARTRGWILAFTQGGHCHFLPVLDVPESARSSRGQSVYALLGGADRSDRIVSMIPVDDLSAAERYLVFLSQKGVIKRTALSEFSNPRAGGVKAAGLKPGDAILEVALSDGLAEVMLLSGSGRAIRFAEAEVPAVGRTAQGVKGMGLQGSDKVVGMLMVRRDACVLTVSEDAMGKRIPVGEFPLQKRGGLGNLVTPSGGSTTRTVAALEVLDADEVMLITGGGQVTRIAADEIPEQGRRTQGRKLMKLPAGDRVVEVTRTQGGGGEPAPAPLLGDPQLDLLGE
ncbi:MAG TPA: DNA gyrase subunit A [Longimicrobiales bacterium]|nr:DNA gyrase subunit A [Longimicrobiales bacterium]